MAVVNIYIDQHGEVQSTKVDELTKHKIGDEIDINDKKFIVLKVENHEHYDYATEININKLVESSRVRRDNFGNL